jgi:TolB protein
VALLVAGAGASRAAGPSGLIAFDRALDGSGQINVIGAGGAGLRALPPLSGSVRPVWSPDGTRLAFANGGDVASVDLEVVPLHGGGARRLTRRPGYDGLASWSPDGRWIAYVATAPNGEPEVWRVDPAGRRRERLARGATQPRWSPDGRRIAWVRAATGALEVAEPGGGPPRRLGALQVSTGPSGPAWSPDGRRIAVVDALGRLAVVSVAAGGVGRLTSGTGAAGAEYPAWSPAGDAVAVVQRGALVLARADGKGTRRLAPADGRSAAAWSPNGRYLAFSDAAHHIAVIRRDGRALRRLTHDDVAQDGNPAWRP